DRPVNGPSARTSSAVIDIAMRPAPESGAAGSGTFTVEVMRSPAGEGNAVVGLAVDDLLARWPSSGSQAEPVREVGGALFTALLGTGAVAGLYRASAALAAERGQSLRVVLRIDSPQLAGLPWEAMFDQATGSYLGRHVQLVRYVPVPVAAAPLTVSPPLRILGVISTPHGVGVLD